MESQTGKKDEARIVVRPHRDSSKEWSLSLESRPRSVRTDGPSNNVLITPCLRHALHPTRKNILAIDARRAPPLQKYTGNGRCGGLGCDAQSFRAIIFYYA